MYLKSTAYYNLQVTAFNFLIVTQISGKGISAIITTNDECMHQAEKEETKALEI